MVNFARFGRRGALAVAGLLAAAAASTSAIAADIHTGGASGAYHSTFCPLLQKRLAGFGSYARKLVTV